MSGHSKWSTIKHKKGAEDKQRGKLFTKLSRAIIVAARRAGPIPPPTRPLPPPSPRPASYSMPKDNIERAIARATGGGEGSDAYEAITYEGYGPEGVAIIVEALTDNRNRTAADVRSIFAKHNSALGTPGSVAWQFERKGVILVPAEGVSEDDMVLAAAEAGAEDVEPRRRHLAGHHRADRAGCRARRARGRRGRDDSAELTLVPANTVALDEDAARKLLRLIDALEDQDDVQDVYANFDIPEAVLEAVAG